MKAANTPPGCELEVNYKWGRPPPDLECKRCGLSGSTRHKAILLKQCKARKIGLKLGEYKKLEPPDWPSEEET